MLKAQLQYHIVRLIELVPREPGTSLPQGATEVELAAFERTTGMCLPIELIEWLKICNGPIVGPGGIYGVAPADKFVRIEAHFELYPEWKDRGWFPIAGDGCGDLYLLDSSSGSEERHPIVFIDQCEMLKPDYLIASDLWHFLYFLLQRELDYELTKKSHWPFDKARVLEIDPDIEQYAGQYPIPWETC